jgi:hypothetical protein
MRTSGCAKGARSHCARYGEMPTWPARYESRSRGACPARYVGARESAVRRCRSRYKVHLVYLVAPKELRAACSAHRRVIFHQQTDQGDE